MPRFSRPKPKKREGRGRYTARRRPCAFCVDKNLVIDYKDPMRLRRFISDRGRIEPRRRTGTCARHQRAVATAVKRARFLALFPYTAEHIRIIAQPPREQGRVEPQPPREQGRVE